MQIGIELNNFAGGRRILIDTKFTEIFSASTYRDQILKSGNLEQLYTFLRSQERTYDPVTLTAEGMLSHPQAGGAVDEVMAIQGHAMRFLECSSRHYEAPLNPRFTG